MNKALFQMTPFPSFNHRQDNDVVLSSRIRLARNLKAYPFPHQMDRESALQVWKKVSDICKDSGFDFYHLNGFSTLEKNILVERHLISKDLLMMPYPALALNQDESCSVMINEEDHLRIQGFASALALEDLWQKINTIDDIFGENLEYAYHDTLGYLTACPSNLGTGLRASVMLHLPLHDMTGESKELSKLYQYGVAIRGAYGEGSKAIGHIYQISNQKTLGKSESELIQTVEEVAKKLIQRERDLRKTLVDKHHLAVMDKVYRAYGVLSQTRLLSEEEAIEKISLLRLGHSMGVFQALDYEILDRAMLMVKNAYVHYHGAHEENKEKFRADIIRELLKD